MPDKKEILFIHALTSLHPGSGTSLGVVDLPIQRERHTQWPVIPGSAIKGVVRDACRENIRIMNNIDRKSANETNDLTAVFGPASVDNPNDAYAGAISFSDARILAFPVRSIRGVFAWVTCPSLVERMKRDMCIAGITNFPDWPKPADGKAVFSSNVAVNGSIVLEEFDFGDSPQVEKNKLAPLATWLAGKVTTDQDTQARIKINLVVLCDGDFTHFVRHATEVSARIALEYDKKTARQGALFYQEFLPAETLFYSIAIATDSRKTSVVKTADQTLQFVRDGLPSTLQIGADETIGKGICAVRLTNGGN